MESFNKLWDASNSSPDGLWRGCQRQWRQRVDSNVGHGLLSWYLWRRRQFRYGVVRRRRDGTIVFVVAGKAVAIVSVEAGWGLICTARRRGGGKGKCPKHALMKPAERVLGVEGALRPGARQGTRGVTTQAALQRWDMERAGRAMLQGWDPRPGRVVGLSVGGMFECGRVRREELERKPGPVFPWECVVRSKPDTQWRRRQGSTHTHTYTHTRRG